MGTKIVLTYATPVRGFLEGKMYNRIKDEKDESFAKYTREQWKQYLDDCFIFRESSTANLLYLEHLLNSLHSDIKFKLLKSTNIIPFLDIMVIKDKTSIVTDIYFKGTDSKQFLNQVMPPKSTKTNIPFSLARRICTIVSGRNIMKKTPTRTRSHANT